MHFFFTFLSLPLLSNESELSGTPPGLLLLLQSPPSRASVEGEGERKREREEDKEEAKETCGVESFPADSITIANTTSAETVPLETSTCAGNSFSPASSSSFSSSATLTAATATTITALSTTTAMASRSLTVGMAADIGPRTALVRLPAPDMSNSHGSSVLEVLAEEREQKGGEEAESGEWGQARRKIEGGYGVHGGESKDEMKGKAKEDRVHAQHAGVTVVGEEGREGQDQNEDQKEREGRGGEEVVEEPERVLFAEDRLEEKAPRDVGGGDAKVSVLDGSEGERLDREDDVEFVAGRTGAGVVAGEGRRRLQEVHDLFVPLYKECVRVERQGLFAYMARMFNKA